MRTVQDKMSPQLVATLADHLGKHVQPFDRSGFETAILAELPDLELKQRGQLIADHMHAILPADLAERNRILGAMLHPDEHDHTWRPSDQDGICGWAFWPLAMVVGQHGLDDFEGSLALLKEMTKRATSEFDVRYFLAADQSHAFRS